MNDDTKWQTRPLYKKDFNSEGHIKNSMDKIISHPSSEEYRKNYDEINWKKKEEPKEKPNVGSLPAPDVFHQVTGK